MQLLHISNSALSLTGSTSDWPEHALIRPSVRTKEISLGPDWPAERGLGSVGAQRCKLGKCHDSKQSTCQKAAKKCCGFPGFLCRKAKEPERDITRRCNIMHVLPLNVPRLKSCRRHGVRLRQHRRRQDCRLLRKYHYARYTQYGLNRALPPIIPRRLQLLYADSYQQTRPQRVSFNFQRNLCPQPHHQRLPTAIPNLKSAPPSGLTWPLDFRSEKKKKKLFPCLPPHLVSSSLVFAVTTLESTSLSTSLSSVLRRAIAAAQPPIVLRVPLIIAWIVRAYGSSL